MKKFKVLPHRADLKIKAFGRDKKELFLNTLLAMTESQKTKNLKEQIKREIKITYSDLPALLVDFLSEALYLGQVNQEVYSRVIFKRFTDKKIEGKLIGLKVKRFGEDVKAVTYHNLDIHQKEDKTWEATVLFDV